MAHMNFPNIDDCRLGTGKPRPTPQPRIIGPFISRMGPKPVYQPWKAKQPPKGP